MVIPLSLIESRLTYEHLRQMPDDGWRYELIEGELVVSPAPKTRHQRIVHKIDMFLGAAEEAGYGQVFVAPIDVVFDANLNGVQPDLVFITTARLSIVAEDNIHGAPDLIAEVLSDSTAERDLGVKLRIYARYGVRFYWVVDPRSATVRVFELEVGGYGERPPLKGQDLLGCALFPGIARQVAELFAD